MPPCRGIRRRLRPRARLAASAAGVAAASVAAAEAPREQAAVRVILPVAVSQIVVPFGVAVLTGRQIPVPGNVLLVMIQARPGGRRPRHPPDAARVVVARIPLPPGFVLVVRAERAGVKPPEGDGIIAAVRAGIGPGEGAGISPAEGAGVRAGQRYPIRPGRTYRYQAREKTRCQYRQPPPAA